MILAALLLQAAAPPVGTIAGGDARRHAACTALVKSDAVRAAAEADAWRVAGGGVPAAQCLGLAYVAQGRWAPAAATFEQAAREAELQRDGRAATLWVQAGNAALGGDDPARARAALDRALALPVLDGALRGEALIDRARAGAALKDWAGARTDLDAAQKLVPGDPLLWLLSATLARSQSDLPRATRDVAEAVRLAPDDADVALEAGDVAQATGHADAARVAWAEARRIDPDGDTGRAAAARLAAPPAAP